MATRTHQVQLDNTERKLCEINFLQLGFVVANPVLDVFSKLTGPNQHESRISKMHQTERS